MPVDPLLQPVLTMMNAIPSPDPSLPPATRRTMGEQGLHQGILMTAEPPPDVASMVDHQIPVDGGEIRVHVYTPPGNGPFPGYVYFHGGGWFFGRVEDFDTPCQEFAVGAKCVVASVEFRLAPEQVPPSKSEFATSDCGGWRSRRGRPRRRHRASRAGSASTTGGNLRGRSGADGARPRWAAVGAAGARGPDHRTWPVSSRRWSRTARATCSPPPIFRGSSTTTSRPNRRGQPYTSPDVRRPLRAAAGRRDDDGVRSVRDDGEAYAAKLSTAGVPTVVKRWAGQIHMSCTMTKILPTAPSTATR